MLTVPTSGDGRVHAGVMPDPEVTERPKRRRFTAEYKLSILREIDAATGEGAIGAILRRERLYSSHLVEWRRARDRGALAGLARPVGRPRPNPLVGGAPGAGVHGQHRTHEHVARPGEDHHERPHPSWPAGSRVRPTTEAPVVDLGLLARLAGRPGHPDPLPGRHVGELRPGVATEAGQADRQPVLVAQSLVDGGHRVGPEHRGDQLPVGRDDRVRAAPRPGVGELREPAPDQLRPLRP